MTDVTRVISSGRFIDGTGNVREGLTHTVVQGKRITRVITDGSAPPTGEGIVHVDAPHATLMPGMMDVHVHLCSINDPSEQNTYMGMLLAQPCLQTLYAARNARVTLEAGFTTVRDVAGFANGRNQEVVALKRAVDIGLVPGPRIFAAGWITPTAGHLDMGTPITWGWDRSTVADGPWECRKVVRSLVRDGVDLIKTSASGGSGGFGEEMWWRNYTVEELSAIAEEAHAFRKKVACHCHTKESVKNALKAGIDTIEHGTELDDECIDLFLETGAIMVPTLMVKSDKCLAGRLKGNANAHIIKKTYEARKVAGEALKKAYAAGVKIATGTDIYLALKEHWGESAYELELLVQHGMSPMEAIVAATKTSAEAVGMSDDIGTIEVGKLADLVLVNGNPLENVALLQDLHRIEMVFKEGEPVVDRTHRGSKSGSVSAQ